MDIDQIWIQLLLLVAVGVVTVMLTRSTADARHQAVRRMLLVAFAVLAVAAVLFPDVPTWVARRLGVGRGADLVLYALVIAFLANIATSYRRMNDLQRKVTELTRQLAITEAVQQEALQVEVANLEAQADAAPQGDPAAAAASAADGEAGHGADVDHGTEVGRGAQRHTQ